ncbi:hypothetical protein B296_00045298 [Ensete ventricosum]|uniref:Uncharacterized protein n=1 Tax=Ensete ventricosum TaxID=4639 RepID=A0A426XJW8_ENSVE|nr:hypothetical protein B296_00045298 [Ensete ventricosum]
MPPPADGAEAEYQSEVRELVDLLSKLNPDAKEFVPSSNPVPAAPLSAVTPFFMASGGFYSNVDAIRLYLLKLARNGEATK